MGTFFTTFFTVLANNFAMIISVILVIFILYVLLTSKTARKIVSALKDSIIKRLMLIPFVAEAVYDRTVREYEDDLAHWKDYLKDVQAEKVKLNDDYARNAEMIKKYEKNAKQALKLGDGTLAMEFAEKIITAQEENSLIEERHIPRVEDSIKAVNERMAELRTLIARTKARKANALREMRGGKMEEELTDSLSGDGQNEAMLAFFEERANYQKNRGLGARVAYEEGIEYKEKRLEANIHHEDAIKLLNQYRTKEIETGKH